jgi:hypothetical protein
MWTLIRNGGVVPMLFILLSGLLALGASFHFALRSERRTLGFIQSMGQATLFATLAATAADLGATLVSVMREWDAPGVGRPLGAVRMMLEGIAESTSPAILGFSFLALSALLTAVGRRRLDERSEVR